MLGVVYEGHGGVAKDLAKATECLRRAAELGHDDARKRLEGLEKQMAEAQANARRLFQDAVDFGEADDVYALALLHREGKGLLVRDERRAIELMQCAADLGNTKAMDSLGVSS